MTLPGLKQNLIKDASLSFPTNIVSTGVASTEFTLANPFTASINLLRLSAKVTFHDLTLGNIPNVDISAHPIVASGHGSVTSPAIPLNFNLDPSTIIQLLLLTSSENDVDLGPLTQLFQFVLSDPGFKPPVSLVFPMLLIMFNLSPKGYKRCGHSTTNMCQVNYFLFQPSDENP